jgi:hypothetical protein
MIIDCDLEITRINDDGSHGETITTGMDEETQKSREIPKLEPQAQWPFETPKEG